jgi:AcrR family transcriptional regulator
VGGATPGFAPEGIFPVLETFKKLPEKRQTAILNAAAHVFAKKGYYRANVSDICRRARISNGALYKYFKNKEDVFLATLHRTMDLVAKGEARYLPVSKPVFDLVYDLLEEVEAFAKEHADYIIIYLDLASPSMKAFSDRVSERMESSSRDFWMKIIEEGKRRGEIDRGLSSRIAAYALDNHVMLFMFSCVSPHYARRFDSYFAEEGKELKREERKRQLVESVRRLLT